MNLIMYESNIYVNNNKFVSIVDNVNVLQVSPGPWDPFYNIKNLLRVDRVDFNSISSVAKVSIKLPGV